MFIKIVKTKGSDLEPIRRVYRWKAAEERLAAQRKAESEMRRGIESKKAEIERTAKEVAELGEEIGA